MTTLVAQCSNCAFWRTSPETEHATTSNVGACAKALVPDEGDVLCQQYEANAAFKQQIISTMLKDKGPMALPVKLVGGKRSAKDAKRALKMKQKREARRR